MKHLTRGNPSRSVIGTLAITLASMILTSGGTAVAGGDRAAGSAASAGGRDEPVFVSGNSTYSDCGLPKSDFALALTGDLKGCWSAFIEDHKCKDLKDYDLYFEEGREVFIGKFHGKQGRFKTTYKFEGAYGNGFCDSFDPSLEVGGWCRHPLTGVSGAFGDAKGLIKFIDVITGVTGDPETGEFHPGTGGNNFVYYGRINFDHFA